MSVTHTVSYYHNYDKEKIRELESNPNIEIISRDTVTGDATILLPMHLEPGPQYLLYHTTYTYRVKSPGQDMTSAFGAGQIPRTPGDTNEFISAFWVNGKPKCRIGYRYDFSRKMCRLIK